MRIKFSQFGLLTLLSCCGLTWAKMSVDLYAHRDKFGQNLQMDVSDTACTNLSRPWQNVTKSIDSHGSCMQFYDRKSCRGRIAVIQPFHTVHQMDLALIKFADSIQSISPCGPKVANGRYVIQSAADASIMTVAKLEGQFAAVTTVQARPFIPKAQQWEVQEKEDNEYDIVPRVHEENYPVTYDGDAMKRGSFIRKVWKLESVGRGRYIVKSEWTGKCLYKTRARTIEEHDCRSWSPNQEWVLRPLLTRPKTEPPKKEPQLADGVNYFVPSRLVEEYLEEQKKDKEEYEKLKKKKTKGTYIPPYKIKNKQQDEEEEDEESKEDDESKDKDTSQDDESKDNDTREDEEEDEESNKKKRPLVQPYRVSSRNPNKRPPPPQVQSIRPPLPQVLHTSHGLPYYASSLNRLPSTHVDFYNGAYPVFREERVKEPVFPEFLMTSIKHDPNDKNDDKYAAPLYRVTRKPITIPLPDNKYFEHPPPKYQGSTDPRRKRQKKKKPAEDSEEAAGDDIATDVAGFLKLLFQGISSRMHTGMHDDKKFAHTFEIRK